MVIRIGHLASLFGLQPQQHQPRDKHQTDACGAWSLSVASLSTLDMSDMPVVFPIAFGSSESVNSLRLMPNSVESWMRMTYVTISEAISTGHQTKVRFKSEEPNPYSLHVAI